MVSFSFSLKGLLHKIFVGGPFFACMDSSGPESEPVMVFKFNFKHPFLVNEGFPTKTY